MKNPLRVAIVAAAGALVLVLAFDSPAPRAEEAARVRRDPKEADRPDTAGPDPENMRRWAEGLAGGDEAARKNVRDRLVSLPEGSRILNALLVYPDAAVRKAAIGLAWSRKDFGALAPGLTALLRDPDLGNRWNAALLLAKTGSAAGFGGTTELVRSMLDPGLRNQVAATHSVGQLGDVSRDALVETLREPSVLLAARAFRKLSGPGIVVQGGEDCAVNALVYALHSSPETPIRVQAARVMRRLRLLGAKEEAELMRAALGDDAADVRIAAAAALVETPADRHSGIVHALREGRHDADLRVRAAIVEALKKLNATEEDLK